MAVPKWANTVKPNDRPIFVVGCPRSGTTMLQLMLHAHPRIALPPETRFLLAAHGDRRRFGDLNDPARRRELGVYVAGSAQFEDLGLDRERVIEAIVAAPPTLGSALGTVFKLYAERFGKPRWGDKRPLYLRYLPTILRLFPDAQIINIVRDGRDCVASLKEAPWGGDGIDKFIGYWTRSADASLLAARRYPRDVYHQLRYEDLVAGPEAHLRGICDFLGEDFDPAMTKPSELASVAVPEWKTWHALTRREVTADRVRSWPSRLSADEVGRCEAAFGDRLAYLGYEPSAPVPRGARVRMGARMIRHRLHPARAAARQLVSQMRPTAPPEPPVAAQLTSRQKESN